MCAYGHAENLKEITWYRERPTGVPEMMITVNSKLQVERENKKFKGRIEVPINQASIRNQTIHLLDVDHNDMSKYWCDVKPDIYNSTWRQTHLEVKGVNVKVFIIKYTT